MLLSAYGFANVILYFPGGWAADRFSTRKLISFSLITTGLVGFYYATFPSFIMLILIHVILAVTTVFTFWAAVIRSVRLLGESKEQGKLFGLWAFGRALTVLLVGFISLQVFTNFGEGLSGMKATINFYSIVTTDKESNISLKEMVKVLKYPAIWLTGALVFASWSVYIGFTFLNPYLKDIVKMTDVEAASTLLYMGVLFTIGTLASGLLADKIGSRVKLMLFFFIGMVITVGAFYLIPGGPEKIIFIIVNITS